MKGTEEKQSKEGKRAVTSRFDEELGGKLETIAGQSGQTLTGLVLHAVKALVQHVEREGCLPTLEITLPATAGGREAA